MATDKPPGLLSGWMASDDLANWDGQGLDDYKVPYAWHELRRGGVRIGRIRMYWQPGGWQIELDGEGQPFTVHDIPKQEGGGDGE